MKSKDLKVGSPQWTAVWERTLANSFVMRCIIEESLNYFRFWVELFLINDNNIYRVRFERFLGCTTEPPKVFVEKYDAPLAAFLADLEHFWIDTGMHNYLTIQELMIPLPHRGFFRPLGITSFLLLPQNHPLLMANYGAVHEWMCQAKRGFIRTNDGAAKDWKEEQVLWRVVEQRFKAFLYQQELSLLKSTIGEVASATYD